MITWNQETRSTSSWVKEARVGDDSGWGDSPWGFSWSADDSVDSWDKIERVE